VNNRGIVKRNGAKKCLPGETNTENGKHVTWNWHKAGVARYTYFGINTSGGKWVKNHALKQFTICLCACKLPEYVFIGYLYELRYRHTCLCINLQGVS